MLFLQPRVSNGQSAEKESESTLKVMTFNIRYGTADDGIDKWDNRKELLYETIKEQAPDLLGMQEALRFQITAIREALPGYGEIGVGRDDGKEAGEYSVILYSTKRFTVDTSGTFWFSDTPNIPGSTSWGNDITRICTWAKLHDKITNKTFYMFNMHLDHISQNSREKSAELLIKRIKALDNKFPIVITGDLNSGEDNPAVITIKDAGYRDTFRDIVKTKENTGTFHGFKGTTDGDKIDYIFVSDDFKTLNAEIIHKNNNGRYPSDHFPVTAKIEYK